MRRRKVFASAAGVAFLAVLFAAWQGLSDTGVLPQMFFPGPDKVWDSLVRGFASGSLGAQTLGTLERMFYGWTLASVCAIAVGALIGSSSLARRLLQPSLEFMRPIPASAVIPLAIALLGLTNSMVVSVVAFGAFWPMLLATVHGFASVEPRLYEVSRVLGLGRWAVISKIALPSALPDILSGLKLGITVALGLSVVGEMLAGRTGLGQWIMLASRTFRAADVFSGVMVLGAIGIAVSFLLARLEARLLAWRQANR